MATKTQIRKMLQSGHTYRQIQKKLKVSSNKIAEVSKGLKKTKTKKQTTKKNSLNGVDSSSTIFNSLFLCGLGVAGYFVWQNWKKEKTRSQTSERLQEQQQMVDKEKILWEIYSVARENPEIDLFEGVHFSKAKIILRQGKTASSAELKRFAKLLTVRKKDRPKEWQNEFRTLYAKITGRQIK